MRLHYITNSALSLHSLSFADAAKTKPRADFFQFIIFLRFEFHLERQPSPEPSLSWLGVLRSKGTQRIHPDTHSALPISSRASDAV
mmetsp:Transcript_25658/g.55555  ORF Transcript_25658/g.55555 Transcript_25658/m.55555 type:complete len:86 (-) Transcript_25658:1669-1926(-)